MICGIKKLIAPAYRSPSCFSKKPVRSTSDIPFLLTQVKCYHMLSPSSYHYQRKTVRCNDTEVVVVALLPTQPATTSLSKPEFIAPPAWWYTEPRTKRWPFAHSTTISTFSIDRQLFPSVWPDACFESLVDAVYTCRCRSCYSTCFTIHDVISTHRSF